MKLLQEILTTNLVIKLPTILAAEDYHEFGSMQDLLSALSGKPVKYFEVNLDEDDGDNEYTGIVIPKHARRGYYHAVFYLGKKPTANDLKKLFK